MTSDGEIYAKISQRDMTPEEREELADFCEVMWRLSGSETEEWNGIGCGCEIIHGQYNCKLNKF